MPNTKLSRAFVLKGIVMQTRAKIAQSICMRDIWIIILFFALWLLFWQRFTKLLCYTYFLRQLQCEMFISLLLKVLQDYILCVKGIFQIQLCVYLSLWTRRSQMKCHFSVNKPIFSWHNPTHWKNSRCNLMLLKSVFNAILTCLDISYQSNLLLATLDFTPSGVNSL